MSAQNKQLEWIEITDFTPGLATVGGNMLEPSTGASQMDDCLVSPFGGLEAGMRAITHSISGIDNPTTSIPKGLYIYGNAGTFGTLTDRYYWAQDGTDMKVYRWDEPSSPSSWAKIATLALGTTLMSGVVADTFVDSGGVEYIIFNIFTIGGSNFGVYSIQRTNNSVVRRLSTEANCVVVQDNIIIMATGDELRWSAAQSVSSWPAENNMAINPSRQGAHITNLNAFAPSDLLIGFTGAPWVVVQGDITQPLVRAMSDARMPQATQKCPLTAGGVAFVGGGQGIFLTSDGSSFDEISQQLAVKDWIVSPAPLGYSNTILLVASGGFVFDERTKSWSNVSEVTEPKHSLAAGNLQAKEIFTINREGTDLKMWTYRTDFADRAGTFTWKSVPLRSNDGRQIAIREVQLYVETFDSNATLAVTIGGVTITKTITSASRQQISFRFLSRDEVLDVKVVSTAGTVATNDAPSIETIRIGYTGGHLLLP